MPMINIPSYSKGNSRVIAIVILVALLAFTGGAVWYFLGAAGPSGSGSGSGAAGSGAGTAAGSGTGNAAANSPNTSGSARPAPALGWADAPSSALAAGGITTPKEIMNQVRGLIQTAVSANPTLDTQWRKAQGELVSYLGVDPTDPSKLPSLGIDPSQPIHISLLEFDAKTEPTGAVLSFGVTSEGEFMSFVKGVADREHVVMTEDTSAEPKVLRFPTDGVLAVSNGRAYIMGGPHDENFPALLRKFLADKESSPILQSPSLKAAVDTIGGPGDATLYVDLKTIVEHNPGTVPAIVADFRSVAAKAGAQSNIASLNFAPGCRLLRALKPGASPKDFIAEADKPLAALSISLDDPAELVRYIAQNSGGGDAGLAQLSATMQLVTGLTFDDWGELLKGGNLGVLWYKADPPALVNVLIYLKLRQDNPQRLKKVQAAVQQLLTMLPNKLPMFARSTFEQAMIGDYLVFGHAAQEMRALSSATTAKWQPTNGDADILTLDLFIGELAQHIQRVLPQVANRSPLFTTGNLQGDGKLTFALQQKGDSLQSSTDRIEASFVPVAMIAALAIPSLLRARMAADETTAANSCKAYCEAQELYHRTDYDHNGILKYSPTLHGLYETKPGAGDIALIPKVFVEAEGNPSKNPHPRAGYCFKVLHGQGPSATGGKRSYLMKQKDGSFCMTLGYALAAYPAKYDSTGRDTFIVNNQGTIFMKDLGAGTPGIVETMTEFDPGQTWIPAQ